MLIFDLLLAKLTWQITKTTQFVYISKLRKLGYDCGKFFYMR